MNKSLTFIFKTIETFIIWIFGIFENRQRTKPSALRIFAGYLIVIFPKNDFWDTILIIGMAGIILIIAHIWD